MATKKSFSKEQWEAMTGTEMSQFLPDDENVESTGESFTGNVGNGTPLTVTEQFEIQSGNLQMPMGKDGAFRHPVVGLAADSEGCHWKNTVPLSCKSRKSKTANPYLSVARCVTGLTSLSANSEAAE